jgi:hypothetical protein
MLRFVMLCLLSIPFLSAAAQQGYVFRPLGQEEKAAAPPIKPGWRMPSEGKAPVDSMPATATSQYRFAPQMPSAPEVKSVAPAPAPQRASPYRYKPKSPNQTGSRPVDLSTLPNPEQQSGADFGMQTHQEMGMSARPMPAPSESQAVQQAPVIEGRYTRHLDPMASQFDAMHHFRPLDEKATADTDATSSTPPAMPQPYPYQYPYQPGMNPYMMPNPYMPLGYPRYPNRHSGPSINGFRFPFIK